MYPQRIYPIDHVIGISFVINHAVTLLMPYFAYIAYDWRPEFISVLRTYGYFLVYFGIVYFLNPLIDGNYFYLKYRPFLHDWPEAVYITGVLVVTFIGFVLAYGVVKMISRR